MNKTGYIRRKAGYSQKQIAEMSGVSLRTIQRYESGQSKNKTLTKLYIEIGEQSKKIDKLRISLQVKGKKYEKSIEAIREFSIKKGISGRTFSVDFWDKEISKKLNNINKLNYNELEYLEGKLTKFSTFKTSTLKGFKEWLKNNREGRREAFGTGSEKYLDLYHKIANNTFLKGYVMRLMRDQVESDSIIKYINEKRESKKSYEEIYNKLKIAASEATLKRTEQEERMNKKPFMR